jgi:hypothetical protein
LAGEEKAWFSARLREVLTKLKAVLAVTGGSPLDQSRVFERAAACASVEALFAVLDDVVAKMFRGMFDEAEWRELMNSQAAMASQREAHLRTLRLRRQRSLLAAAQKTAVEFTVHDGAEQSTLVSECMQMMQNLIARVGMNPRGTLRRSTAGKKTSEEEPAVRQKKRERAAVPASPKEKPKKKQAKEPSEDEEDDDEEEEEEGNMEEEVRQVEVAHEEAEDEEEEEVDAADVGDALLRRLSDSAETVTEMWRKYRSSGGSLSVAIGAVEPPDRSWAEPTVLELQRDTVARLMEEGDDADITPLEQWSSLIRFWRLAKRAFVIVAIFRRLESTQSRGNTRLLARYEKLVKGLNCSSNAVRYRQATSYRRIGQCLLEYPRLLYQLHLTTLQEWSGAIGLLEGKLAASRVWKEPPRDDSSSEEEEVCCVCRLSDRGAVWSCSECKKEFHELCAGYEEGQLRDNVPLEGRSAGVVLRVRSYCGVCLNALGKKPSEIARTVAEITTVAQFFNAPECPFALELVAGDGYCLVGILERFARARLGLIDSSDKFCNSLAEAALQSFEAAAAEIPEGLLDEAEKKSVAAFKEISRTRGAAKRVKAGLWQLMEAQHLLRGYAEFLFPGQVVVRSFQATDDGRFGESARYGTSGIELSVLQWNTAPHYDAMVPPETRE